MDIEPLLAHLHLVEGGSKIIQLGTAEGGLLYLANQILISDIEKIAEGNGVRQGGFFLKILGIHLDRIKKGGGQSHRRLQSGGPQVFNEHGGGGAEVLANIDKRGDPALGGGMVVNDHIKGDILETGQMARLGIQHHLLGEIPDFNGMQTFHGNLQQIHHDHIV